MMAPTALQLALESLHGVERRAGSVYVYVQMLCIHRAPGPTRLLKFAEHLALQGCELSDLLAPCYPLHSSSTPYPSPPPICPIHPHHRDNLPEPQKKRKGGHLFQLVKLAQATCLRSGGPPRKSMFKGKVYRVQSLCKPKCSNHNDNVLGNKQ
jgi:hypothetical protein